MTPQEIEDVGQNWQRRLGLERWKIEFPFGDELKRYWADAGNMRGSHAGCWRSRHYNHAKIYVNIDDYENWSYEEGTGYVVHELVHLLTRDMEFLLDVIDDHMPKDAMDVVEQYYNHHVEQSVDNIAQLFVKAYAVEDEAL